MTHVLLPFAFAHCSGRVKRRLFLKLVCQLTVFHVLLRYTVLASSLDASFLSVCDLLQSPMAARVPLRSRCDSFPESMPSPGGFFVAQVMFSALPEPPSACPQERNYPARAPARRDSSTDRVPRFSSAADWKNGANRSRGFAQS